eukprot:CAMPEP_0198310638 /NCGR_PEP_ID=MMETSP1450-20131203/2642_1 /TAXON_ID=753684 ORGANISM="Madagascaria erythrocladiodes, Strain CCMP3234" /NCGR_SAMPLE_ID=MMETSP1450 /ASSEMBLY_ACC=CAM_ASM_001115 /LENGTH=384 /DNA_ID=CAMNT_0044013481 /DNA_START=57 /DNA_END=1211 /DNA_ORIENTATION=+
MTTTVCVLLLLGLAAAAAAAALPVGAKKDNGDRDECFEAPRQPGDRRRDHSVLRVGTLNMEWLFWRRLPPRGPFQNRTVLREHIRAMAKVVKEIDVDVLNLVEVDGCDALDLLLEDVGDDTYKPYLIKGRDSATGQNVGLITRVDPIVDLKRTDDRVDVPADGVCVSDDCPPPDSPDVTTGVSKHYYTKIAPYNSKPIMIVSLHFIAFPTRKDRCQQRQSQARLIQEIVQKNYRGDREELIITGDMNDFDGDVPDVSASEPITCALKMLKSTTRYTGAPPPTAIAANNAAPLPPTLRNVAQYAPQAKRYTAYYQPNKRICQKPPLHLSSIDHLLFSDGLYQRVHNVDFAHDLYREPCYYEQPLYSDHWPLIAVVATTNSSHATG